MKKLQTINGSITKSYVIGTGSGQLPPGQYRAFFKGDFNSFATLPATYAIGTDGLTTDVQKDIKKEQLSTSVDGWNYAVDEDRTNLFDENGTFTEPSISYSDSFTSDTSSRYQAISGTSAYDSSNTRLSLTAPASTWNKTRLKSYKFESGRFTQKLVLPATGHEGDIVAHFFNSAADCSTNYGVGLKRLASNLWLPVEIKDNVVVTTGTSPLAPLQDGMTVVLEVEEDQVRGVSWLSVWKDGTANVMAFDGVNDGVNCGNSSILNLTSSCSYSLWVNITEQPALTAQYRLLDKSGTSPYGVYISYINSTGVYYLHIYYATGGSGLSVVYTLPLHTPVHLVFIHNDATDSDTIYCNNVVLNTASGKTSNPGTQTSNFYIGCEGGAGKYIKGTINNVNVYNRALTSAECNALYNGQHISTGLVAHYVNTGNTDSDWIDRSGNGNNGTVSGSPTTTSVTGSKTTGTTLKQFAQYSLAHTATGFYNAHTAENTAELELIESRARSMLGYTNAPATESVSFVDDFNENSIGKYTTTGTHAITGNELVCSVAGTVKLQNTFGNGTYQYSTKIANGSTDYFYFGSHRLKLVQYASSCDIKLETAAGVQVGSTTWNKTITAGSAFFVKVVQAANSIIVYDGATAKITETPTTGTGQPYWSLTANSAIDSISVTATRHTFTPMLRGASKDGYWNGSEWVADVGKMYLSGVEPFGFFISDGNPNNTGNWAGLKFTNHDRDTVYTNTINVGTSTVTDGTGIYYDLIRKNMTDNTAISPTKAMVTALPIGTASTQTAADITLDADDVGDDIALYVQAKSDSAPVLQLTSETLVKNSLVDTTSNNYYFVDFDVDEADIGKTVQIGVFQNDQPSDNYYILDYLVMSPTELIEKHAKRALWNASPMTKTMKSSIR